MNDIIIRQPDPAEHEQAGSVLVQQAMAAMITCNDDRELAGSVIADLSSAINQILFEFDGTPEKPGPVSLAYKTWKSGVALRDRAVGKFVEAKNIWMGKVRKFEYDVEKQREREAAEQEAKAAAVAAEERRIAIEAAKKANDTEAARALKQAPLVVNVAPPKTPEVTKAEGIRRSNPIWAFDIVDANKLPRKYLIPDEKAIRRIVQSLGPKHGIPGISVYDARSEG